MPKLALLDGHSLGAAVFQQLDPGPLLGLNVNDVRFGILQTNNGRNPLARDRRPLGLFQAEDFGVKLDHLFAPVSFLVCLVLSCHTPL